MNNDRIKLIQGDITSLKVDAIVNAANSSLLGGGGVDGAIHKAGGNQILLECKEIIKEHGRCPNGHAVITNAGKLPAKFVIHTVGPVWYGGNNNEEEELRNSYRNSLELAVKHGLKTIAFPNISTGVYRFPKKEAAKIAVSELKIFLTNNQTIEQIIFICFNRDNFEIYKPLI